MVFRRNFVFPHLAVLDIYVYGGMRALNLRWRVSQRILLTLLSLISRREWNIGLHGSTDLLTEMRRMNVGTFLKTCWGLLIYLGFAEVTSMKFYDRLKSMEGLCTPQIDHGICIASWRRQISLTWGITVRGLLGEHIDKMVSSFNKDWIEFWGIFNGKKLGQTHQLLTILPLDQIIIH